MKVSKEVKESLDEISELMLSLAKEAYVFAGDMTRASAAIASRVARMEVEDE